MMKEASECGCPPERHQPPFALTVAWFHSLSPRGRDLAVSWQQYSRQGDREMGRQFGLAAHLGVIGALIGEGGG